MSKDIKIFVSHRIDLDSVTIDNPLYVPVYCGAVYKDKSEWNPDIIGDDTGDNISEKRRSFCEFTVQYWVWKNVRTDYYGLCHYRRYLSFADKYIDCNEPHRFAVAAELTFGAVTNYALLNYKKMKQEISKYDVITSVTYPVDNLPHYPVPHNEREVWRTHPDYLISDDEIELTLDIIKEKFPQYYKSACEMMDGEYHRGFNCFIMSRKYFYEMCEFEFGVLFELEQRLNIKEYAGKRERVFGYLGEILYGTYMVYIKEKIPEKYFCEKQIVLFRETASSKLPNPVKNMGWKEKICRQLFPNYYISQQIKEKMGDYGKSLDNLNRQMKVISRNIASVEKRTFHMFNIEKWDYQMHALPFGEIDKKRADFWASFPKASGDLRLVQKGNSFMLSEMLRMCNILNIKFWLHGGSLVGALRHKGAVPWDDDIDVAMMRDDFERLRSHIGENEPTYEIGEYYYCVLGCRSYRLKKICKEETLPFFVDIFIYDIYECQESPLEEWKKLRMFHRGMLGQMNAIGEEYGHVPQNEQLDENPKLKEKMDNLIDSYVQRFKSDKGDYILWGLDNNYENETRYAWHNGRIFHKKDIFPLRECKYEGLTCYIPADFEKYSIAEYGFRYLDMPDVMGNSIHFDQYFKGVDLHMAYRKLTGRDYIEESAVVSDINAGIPEDIYSRFIFPWRIVWPDAKVLIYGGGVVGSTFMEQLREHPCCKVLAIIDQYPAKVNIVECPVIAPGELNRYSNKYDLILIAVEKREIALSIKKFLIAAGADENKIYWQDYTK